jgi:hypothetical protein
LAQLAHNWLNSKQNKGVRLNYTAYNGRFCEMAAVSPQTGKYLIASSYPVANSVEAATSQSRWTLYAIVPKLD